MRIFLINVKLIVNKYMNRKIIIANWKMQLGLPESIALAKSLKKITSKKANVVLCPSFISLTEVAKVIKKSDIMLGGQDCFWEAKGAYTGEISASYLKEVGCQFVIIGHSERRKNLGETDEMVNKKIKLALDVGLVPIVCVGENFEQRQQGSKEYVLIQQATKAFEGVTVSADQQVIIAYEPVWAISTSRTGQFIEPPEAEFSHQVVRQSLFDIFSSTIIKNNFSIIYGGSVDGNNVNQFIHLDHTAGALVGGASLTADNFKAMVANIQTKY